MRILILVLASCLGVALGGCGISHTTNERRVVELPKDHPDATLATAQKICRDLIAAGYGAEVQAKFPSLPPQQARGLYLNWNVGVFTQSGKSVFITCGINYAGDLPQAKEVADYCQTLVKKAVDRRFMLAPK
jgi:hypothetical protein